MVKSVAVTKTAGNIAYTYSKVRLVSNDDGLLNGLEVSHIMLARNTVMRQPVIREELEKGPVRCARRAAPRCRQRHMILDGLHSVHRCKAGV